MRDVLNIYCLVILLFASAAMAQDAAPETAQQAAVDMKSPIVSSADVHRVAAGMEPADGYAGIKLLARLRQGS